MQKEIKYSGLSAIPDDYQSPDGHLDASLNLINEDGQLKPLPQPAVEFSLNNGDRVMCIHRTAYFTHYIILDSEDVFIWIDGSNTSSRHSSNFIDNSIVSIVPMGNLLVL